MYTLNAINTFKLKFKRYKSYLAIGSVFIFAFPGMAHPDNIATETRLSASFGSEKATTFSVLIPKQKACGLSYTNEMGEYKTLNFYGSPDKDTVVTQSLNLQSPTAFVWGFLQDSKGKLFLTKYAILAKPGDNLSLALNNQYQLSSQTGKTTAFLADNTASFYGTLSFGNGGKKLGNADGKAAYSQFNKTYYQNLLSAYQKEVERLNRLKAHSEMDAGTFAAANLYARAFFYDKLFVLAEESKKYPEVTLPILEKHLAEIEKMLKEPNLVLSGEVVRTISGLVKTKLMAKNIDWNNLLNLYEEGKNMDLGIFKSTFLTYCLVNYPVKQLSSYQSAVADFNHLYASTDYSRYVNSVLSQFNKPIELSSKEKFITNDNQSFSIKEIAQKTSTSFVVIDLWASWCKPCLEQFPIIDSLKQEFKAMDIPVSFVTINMDEKKDNWLSAAKQQMKYLLKNNYHLQNAPKSDFVKKLNIASIPFTIVLKDGKIIANNFTLPAELSFKKDLMDLINQHQQQPASPPLYTSRQ